MARSTGATSNSGTHESIANCFDAANGKQGANASEPSRNSSGSDVYTLHQSQPSISSAAQKNTPSTPTAQTTPVAKTVIGQRSYRGLHGSRARINEQRAILDVAYTRSGFYNFGTTATKGEANDMGKAFVGPGATVKRNGKEYISSDGLRRSRPSGDWQSNGHLDIAF